jgi:hypothetical protein
MDEPPNFFLKDLLEGLPRLSCKVSCMDVYIIYRANLVATTTYEHDLHDVTTTYEFRSAARLSPLGCWAMPG